MSGAVKSPLAQWAFIMNPVGPVTEVRPMPAELWVAHGGSAYVDGDPLPATYEPDSTPTSITARRIISGAEWERRILKAGTIDEAMTAIKEAGKMKDGNAAYAIGKLLSSWDIHLDSDQKDLCFDAVVSIGAKSLPGLMRLFGEERKPKRFKIVIPHLGSKEYRIRATIQYELLAECIERLSMSGVNCRSAVPALIAVLNAASIVELDEILHVLGTIGDRRAIEPIKKFVKMPGVGEVDPEGALKKLGLSDGEIAVIKLDLSPLQQAAYRVIAERRDAKRLVFENAKILDVLPDKQAWITINKPQLAKDTLRLVVEKAGKKRGKLDNLLAATLGVRANKLEDAHFTYYADEMLDAIAQFVRGSKLRNDPDVSSLLSQVRFGEDVKLRYIRREKSDLTLGDKCGDCTARGSIHFGDSLTWLVNPAYHILRMSKGRRFIGKIQFTLGTFRGKEGIIVDALEFNPQAQKGKPYYQDARECLDAAMAYLKELASRQNAALFALRVSNSSGALEILADMSDAEKLPPGSLAKLQLLDPTNDVGKILSGAGYKGDIALFYQMLEGVDATEGKAADRMDERLPALEREVINPAQIADEEIAAAMRNRDFEEASKRILSDEGWARTVNRVLGLPLDIPLSPTFLVKKLQSIYRAEAVDDKALKKYFMVHLSNFLEIKIQ